MNGAEESPLGLDLGVATQEELAKAAADNPYAKFGRWVLSDPATRTISPYSKSAPSPKP